MISRRNQVVRFVNEYIQNKFRWGRPKVLSLIILIALSTFLIPALAQDKKDSLANGDEFFKQWLDYSRPGKYHQLLGNLVGNWTFKGRHYTGDPNPDLNKVEKEFNGTINRKAFANGRYFIVELTGGGKIQMPIQDGKMKEVNATEIEFEGYDNIKRQFVKAKIANHMGSDLSYSEGSYDSASRTIIYQRVETLVPGIQMKTYDNLTFVDNDHYTFAVYRERDNKIIKDTEVSYTRVKEK